MATWAEIQQYFPQVQSTFDGEGVQRYSINPADRTKEIPGIGTVAFQVSDTDPRIIATVPGKGNLAPGPNGELTVTRGPEPDRGGFFGGAISDVLTDPKMWAVLGGGVAANMGALGNLGSSVATGPGTTASLGASAADLEMLGAGLPTEVGAGGTGFNLGGGAGVSNAAYDGFMGSAAADGLVGSAPEMLSKLGGAASAPGAASTLSKILSGNGSMQDLLGLLGPAMELYSGKEGLDRAKDMTNLVSGDVNAALGQSGALKISDPSTSAAATKAIAGADPWTASGGRALADEQLQALMRSPGSLMEDPGYKAKMMGVDRVMAAQGQLGGGGGAVAAANASGDYYDQRLKSLSQLENLGDPVNAQKVGLDQGLLELNTEKAQADLGFSQSQLGLEGARIKLAAAGGANTLAGQSLAAIGSGVTRATGGNTWMSQAQEFLKQYRASGATI